MALRQGLPQGPTDSDENIAAFQRRFPEREHFLVDFPVDAGNPVAVPNADDRAWADAEIDRAEDSGGLASTGYESSCDV